jgi:predicted nucleotidyltransferase
VSEYNPFHFGHAALIEKTRLAGATHMIAVMSGNFVQRGEPAILSKWARTRMALQNGIDLVIELPLPWAMSGAEHFAFGAVSLLNALGCVDSISFGSECGNVKLLQNAAQAVLSPRLKQELQQYLKDGATFAKARQAAIEHLFDSETAMLLENPNNILGIEYCKALRKLNSSITPFTVKRIGAQHDEKNVSGEPDTILSSSQIREKLRAGIDAAPFLPPAAAKILAEEIACGNAPADAAKLETAILIKLRGMSREEFGFLPDISEGLENRIYHAVREAVSLDDLYDKVKSKRYTHARIRRLIYSAFLGLQNDSIPPTPPYVRVLGFNQSGKEILHLAKSTTKLPIITNSSDILSLDKHARNMIELECNSTDVFVLSLPHVRQCGLEMTTGILTI